MCGIAGLYGTSNLDCIKAMVAAMHHRGPDDSGTWIDQKVGVALGNARLAIVDLSPTGHMPMTDGTRWITYNGEVYNYLELRRELENFGHSFNTGSDTEVILAAYRQWNTECLVHFRGMFAFAIYDPGAGGQLFLARDHFGIKPLYWASTNNGYIFASELKALLASGFISRNVDPQAIWDYFSVGSVIPPRTIYQEVSALLPGHAMIIKEKQAYTWRWWDLYEASQRVEAPSTLEEAALEVRRLLDESVGLQMIADVPVGTFLSGGIDSTTIAALMSEQSAHPIRSYSVAFQTSGGAVSELPYARIVSERYGTAHEEIIVTENEILQRFDQLILALDQPSVDGFNSYLVSQAASRGVTVALSGLGSDEIFAGYHQFGRFAQASALWPEGCSILATTLQKTGNMLPGSWRLPLEFLAASPANRYCAIRRVFTDEQKTALLNPDLVRTINLGSLPEFYQSLLRPGLSPIEQTSYVEIKGYMAYTLLRDIDAMSMAHSVEVRVPFLDHKLVEFVFALPGAWKWRQGQSKIVLKHAMAALLPEAVVTRPKRGFDLPVADWIQSSLKHLFQDTIRTSVAATMFSRNAQRAASLRASTDRSFGSWSILLFLRWMLLSKVSL